MTSKAEINMDPQEVAKFDAMATRWWDPGSEFKPLHDINPLRLHYIDERTQLDGKRVLDIGCGGGILSESMAAIGAEVTGIDLAGGPLSVAKLHLMESGLQVDYQQISAEEKAAAEPNSYDVVTCMELLEHVPDPASLIKSCSTLVKPDGHVFFSTLNRNPKAYMLAIIGAEYLLKMLAKGTHDYEKFIKPSELASWLRASELDLHDITGLSYNPLTRQYALGSDIDVNYMVHCTPR